MRISAIFFTAILSCTNAWASGVDYSNACGIAGYGKRSGQQALPLKVRFKSAEAICSKDDGCVAARYVATVLEGPPEEVNRDVTVITSANVVLGKRYLIFVQKLTTEDNVARFPSELFYREADIAIPKDTKYITSPPFMFRLYGSQYYRTVPAAGSDCNLSPDCDWINAHKILDFEPVASIEVHYPKLEEELAICKTKPEPNMRPYEVYRELNKKASNDASEEASKSKKPQTPSR